MTTTPPRRRRRSTAAQVVTILWRDIPAQVVARRGDESAKVVLSARFQHAIDKAARVAGLTERHAYLQQWRRTAVPFDHDDDPTTVAAAFAAELEQALDRAALAALVRSGGVDASPLTSRASKEHA